LLALALAAVGFACTDARAGGDRGLIPSSSPTPAATRAPIDTPQPATTPEPGITVSPSIPVMNPEINLREWRSTNFRRYVTGLDPREFFAAGSGKNGIQPVYQPQFVSIQEAQTWEWMTPTHPVVVLELNGDPRAYPIGIVNAHEVVNDVVGGEPVLVTYSPLTYSSVGFKRTVEGAVLTFGATGVLRNSNLVLWDDRTESWWQQATGQALIGDMAGAALELVPVFVTSMAEFAQTYPEGKVLSQQSVDPYYLQLYGKTPYLGYDAPNNPPFAFYGELDPRMNPVERVIGLQTGDTAIAFPFSVLRTQRIVHTSVGRQPVVVFWEAGTLSALDKEEIPTSRDVGSAAAFDPTVNGQALTFTFQDGVFRDEQTGSTWSLLGKALSGPLAGTQLTALDAENGMWFYWAAFHPDTDIYRPS
jgi:hypothetical protein